MVLTLRLSPHFPDVAGIFLLRLLPFRERSLALQEAQIVDEKFSVEMIYLVLETSTQQLVRACFVRAAGFVHRADRDLGGPLDIAVDVGNRKASLFRFV